MNDKADFALLTLRKIQRRFEQSARGHAETEGLTPSQLKVLQLLTEYTEVSVGWISEQTRLKNATITSLIDKLEARNMVSRRRCDTDRRRVWVKMEPQGLAALSANQDLIQETFKTRFTELPGWQQTMLLSSLELLADIFETEKACSLDTQTLSIEKIEPQSYNDLPDAGAEMRTAGE